MTSFASFLSALQPEIETALDRFLPADDLAPQRLHAAMRYSIFAGGKRVRPALVVLAGELFGAHRRRLLAGAAAMEMIHTFSLIHDDLPGLDDDDLRRGRPTLHRQYDEALAILAGDALLNHALGLLVREPADADGDSRARAVEIVTDAVGSVGMIGGQVADMEAESEWPADPQAALELIHQRKTGCLLTASLRIGGVYGGASQAQDALLGRLGACVGLLFQIGDDVLDVEATTEQLGKTAGKDAAVRKLTFAELYGVEASKRRMAELVDEGVGIGRQLDRNTGRVAALLRYLQERDS